MAGDGLAVLVEKGRALIESVIEAVDYSNGVAAAIQHEDPPAVSTWYAVDRAFAEWNVRRNGEAGNLKRISLAKLRDGCGRIVAGYAEGYVLADGINVLSV